MLQVVSYNPRKGIEVKPLAEFSGKITRATFNGRSFCVFMRKDLSIARYYAIYNESSIQVKEMMSQREADEFHRSGYLVEDITPKVYPHFDVKRLSTFEKLRSYEPSKQYSSQEAMEILFCAMQFLSTVGNMLDKELSQINN